MRFFVSAARTCQADSRKGHQGPLSAFEVIQFPPVACRPRGRGCQCRATGERGGRTRKAALTTERTAQEVEDRYNIVHAGNSDTIDGVEALLLATKPTPQLLVRPPLTLS